MLGMLRFRELTPALLRHLDGYFDLTKDVLVEWRASFTARLLCAIAGVVFSVSAVLFASLWALLAAWNSPWRHWIAAGILLLLLALGVSALAAAVRTRAAGPLQNELLRQLARDRALLHDAQRGRDES